MEIHSHVEILPIYPLSSAKSRDEFMSTTNDTSSHLSRSNSNSSEQENILNDYVLISSPASVVDVENNSSDQILLEEEEEDDDSDYYAQFSCPEDSDADLEYFYDDNNDDLFLNNHLNRKQVYSIDSIEQKNYQRSKRSNKKLNAQRQIKTKYAKSIKIKSHNKHLYMHHRLFKKVNLDAPSNNYIASPEPVPSYSPEALRSILCQCPYTSSSTHNRPTHNRPTHSQNKTQNQVTHNENPIVNTSQFREYTINEHNIPSEPSFDDAMITFLLEMQNRDLSPEDYEMLLRLDERVQRKTINTNILNTLPTVDVNETHVNDQCTICMEAYTLGQQLKLLPCSHLFHANCIETYLKDFSTQCPLDNIPLI